MGRGKATLHKGSTLIGIILLLSSLGCTDLEPPQTVSDDDEVQLPELELYSASVRYTRCDKPMFVIDAPKISRFEIKQKLHFEGGIKVDFYDRDGIHNAIMTSNEGEVMERQNKLVARGNVVVKSDSGLVLLTDELYYIQQENRIISNTYVTVITDNDSLSGVGFSASPDLNDWVILNTSGTTWRNSDELRKEQ
ncbi:LPS export ABC transporter periplasmic protein LptC [bacterium]|nr:LPS export ABC transporter periplasmic protein LptC [bacterium]